jgi:hypothetical protein
MYMSVAPVQNGVLLVGGASFAHCHKHVLSMSAHVPAQNTTLEPTWGTFIRALPQTRVVHVCATTCAEYQIFEPTWGNLHTRTSTNLWLRIITFCAKDNIKNVYLCPNYHYCGVGARFAD